jgi:hypothetical protein
MEMTQIEQVFVKILLVSMVNCSLATVMRNKCAL